MRILLARPDHLGDVLLTLPAAAALRRLLPDAQLTYLVGPGTAVVPQHCPDVDATLTLPFPPPTAPPAPQGWAEVAARGAAALRGRFDLAILPRPDDPWSGAVVVAAGIPVRIGFDMPVTRPFLTVPVPLSRRQHVTRLALVLVRAAVRALGRPDPVPFGAAAGGRFVPTPADEAEAAAMLDQPGADAAPGPIVLHPGSGWAIKNWSPARWGVLAARLRDRYGTVPLVVGGPGEDALVEAVVRASERAAHGLAGRLSLGGLAALHRRARLVVATDGGPLHLAALVGAPVVGLYGPADPLEFGPIGPPERRRVVRVPLPCSPCRRLDAPPCGLPVAPPCVTGISVGAVLSAAADLLAASEERPAVAAGRPW